MKIHVSSLNGYSFCPRNIYLSHVLKIEPEPSRERSYGLIGHAIRKELSLRQSKLLGNIQNTDDIKILLLEELNSILKDIPYIYKEMLQNIEIEGLIPEIRNEVVREIKTMSENLGIMVNEIGIYNALKKITPWKVEYPLESKKLGFSGRIDKVMKEDTYIPIEIKTGEVPESVWEGDRLQTCAYAMLLEEKFRLKKPIQFGYVEYTRAQERRPVMTTEQIRRRVINTRDEIIEILEGKIPEICPHGSGRKCDACGYKERCYEI